jgi:hypothetical protein
MLRFQLPYYPDPYRNTFQEYSSCGTYRAAGSPMTPPACARATRKSTGGSDAMSAKFL